MLSSFFTKVFTFILSVIMFLSTWLCPVPKNAAVITFDANPSTGYSWVCEMDPEGIVEVSKEFFKNPPRFNPVAGASGTYTFVLMPLADGETTLTFYYMQTWLGHESAARVESYDFTVTDGVIHMEGPIFGWM